ncbi:hypothetical protein ACFPRL_16935 [Pseudoclavibacter helvolus]
MVRAGDLGVVQAVRAHWVRKPQVLAASGAGAAARGRSKPNATDAGLAGTC